uniref:cationic trypsin-like n=1 Tax=Epinephelus lanceolatus TaxID=310571 RepID=UPI001446CC44|nr:cationic trypsin-like [Epinephelus lanceolatus]
MTHVCIESVTVSTVVDLQKRIIGGQECRGDERRYHVRITDGTHETFCGGSLISNQWILTAAHCQEPGWTIYANLSVHPGQGYEVVQITAPPTIYTDNGVSHDIMLLKLPNPTQVQPVPLPRCNDRPRVGDAVQIAGYAATTAGPNNVRGTNLSSFRFLAPTPTQTSRLKKAHELNVAHVACIYGLTSTAFNG